MYAKIIIDLAHNAVNRPYTYVVPAEMDLLPGHHVLVPFGSGSKKIEGFVIDVFATPKVGEALPETCKTVDSLIEAYTLFTQKQIDLAVWMSSNYNCLLIDALRCMIPAQIRGRRIKEKSEKTYLLVDRQKTSETIAFMRSGTQKNILRYILNKKDPTVRSEIRALFPNSSAALKALESKDLIYSSETERLRKPSRGIQDGSRPVLTNEQEKAIFSFESLPIGGTALLYGVTGSGKTEVYLRLIENCLQENRGAIVLVPEIALTPQTVGRFSARFGDKIAVLHSGLTAGQRFDEWRRIRSGEALITIGARSAVFAPVQNLGLIVIDEEQESSYQSETVPRYSASEIARKRVSDESAKLLLGSATPSLLSYYRALNGSYALLSLPTRVWSRPMPKVELIDMRTEFLSGNNGIFSAKLTEGLRHCLSRRQQAMLFINRRGYSTFVSCRSCGYIVKCERCDISMTYHKSENRMRCHYCGAVKPLPEECPNCRKPFIKQFGIGTEQVEEQLLKLFPQVRALRMDTDTVKGKDGYERILSSFALHEADVLIGTQMIAKGHDFPNVTLVGIVAADLSLNLPDFRSTERTFQLLTQMSGRAGRDSEPGEVFLQTYNTSHPVFPFARNHDYSGFYQYEIAQRRKCLYPPFSVFLRVVLQGTDEEKLNLYGAAYAKKMEKVILTTLGDHSTNLLLVHASPAPIMRIAGMYRFQILFKLLRTARFKDVIKAVYSFENENIGEYSAKTEINPIDMF